MTWAIATPLGHINFRRWLAELAQLVTHPVGDARRRPRQGPAHAHREPFIEEAAMAREMLRL